MAGRTQGLKCPRIKGCWPLTHSTGTWTGFRKEDVHYAVQVHDEIGNETKVNVK